jgi:hypothetical protein
MVDPRYVEFFARYQAQYPNFDYIPSHDWRQHDAFNNLFADTDSVQVQGHRTSALREIQEIWAEIIKEEFKGETLFVYQTMCQQLEKPVLDSIKGCKAKLQEVNVNIVDFIQYRKDLAADLGPGPITKFDSLEELREYSRKERKALPIELVTGPLKILLKRTH